jgi:acyl-CoA synthetase (NDP forming)
MTSIAIIGASPDRNKYGNKAVRAYLNTNFTVYAVNPNYNEVEGVRCYPSVLDIPDAIDIASFYVPPQVGLKVIEEVAQKSIAKVLLNPGADSPQLLQRAQELGLDATVACSLILAASLGAES